MHLAKSGSNPALRNVLVSPVKGSNRSPTLFRSTSNSPTRLVRQAAPSTHATNNASSSTQATVEELLKVQQAWFAEASERHAIKLQEEMDIRMKSLIAAEMSRRRFNVDDIKDELLTFLARMLRDIDSGLHQQLECFWRYLDTGRAQILSAKNAIADLRLSFSALERASQPSSVIDEAASKLSLEARDCQVIEASVSEQGHTSAPSAQGTPGIASRHCACSSEIQALKQQSSALMLAVESLISEQRALWLATSSLRRNQATSSERRRGDDALRSYNISAPTALRATASPDGEIIGELQSGTHINILEIVSSDLRMCGRVQDPPGWVVLSAPDSPGRSRRSTRASAPKSPTSVRRADPRSLSPPIEVGELEQRLERDFGSLCDLIRGEPALVEAIDSRPTELVGGRSEDAEFASEVPVVRSQSSADGATHSRSPRSPGSPRTGCRLPAPAASPCPGSQRTAGLLSAGQRVRGAAAPIPPRRSFGSGALR